MNGPGIPALQASDKQPFVGQKFQANFVPVQKKISDSVFLVGPKNATPTLLVLTNNSTAGTNGRRHVVAVIDAGTLIDITGTIRKPPPQAQARKQWSLSGKEAAQLERQGGYIESTISFYVPR